MAELRKSDYGRDRNLKIPAKNHLTPEQKEKLQKALKREVNGWLGYSRSASIPLVIKVSDERTHEAR